MLAFFQYPTRRFSNFLNISLLQFYFLTDFFPFFLRPRVHCIKQRDFRTSPSVGGTKKKKLVFSEPVMAVPPFFSFVFFFASFLCSFWFTKYSAVKFSTNNSFIKLSSWYFYFCESLWRAIYTAWRGKVCGNFCVGNILIQLKRYMLMNLFVSVCLMCVCRYIGPFKGRNAKWSWLHFFVFLSWSMWLWSNTEQQQQ